MIELGPEVSTFAYDIRPLVTTHEVVNVRNV